MRTTKSMLIKENESLKNKIAELEKEGSSLKKELNETKTRLSVYEKMPETIGNMAGSLWTSIFPVHK